MRQFTQRSLRKSQVFTRQLDDPGILIKDKREDVWKSFFHFRFASSQSNQRP